MSGGYRRRRGATGRVGSAYGLGQRRHTAPDVGRKARASIAHPGTLGDAAERAKFLEGISRVETADLVDIPGKVSGEHQAVVQRQVADDVIHHLVYQRGAVDRDGVVE